MSELKIDGYQENSIENLKIVKPKKKQKPKTYGIKVGSYAYMIQNLRLVEVKITAMQPSKKLGGPFRINYIYSGNKRGYSDIELKDITTCKTKATLELVKKLKRSHSRAIQQGSYYVRDIKKKKTLLDKTLASYKKLKAKKKK